MSTLQQQALRATDVFEIDRVERALDEILRRPESTAPAESQVYTSRGHAAETLLRRRAILGGTTIQLGAEVDDEAEYDERAAQALAVAEPGYVQVEFDHWLATTEALNPRDRILLRALAAGEDAASLASFVGVGSASMSQRLSRCRRRGRNAYVAEVRSA